MVLKERVPVGASFGRILAADVIAPADLPRFDAAAMDGFALRSGDLPPGETARLKIADTVAAGHPSARAIRAGEAARIFTGAMLPEGAERVVVQELCREVGGEVFVTPPAGRKPHIRRRGEDVRRGDVALRSGQRIGPAQLALLAALQAREVTVLGRLRVALVSTGDELREGPAAPGPGEIADSNRPMLRAMLAAAGCEVRDLGIVADDAERILGALVDAAQGCDLIVTSGGASSGATDHLRRSIGRRGFLEFWRLALRPGRPVGFGDIDDCPILALPGNPMAAAVGFVLLGRPLVALLSGDPAADPEPALLPLGEMVHKLAGRTDVLAGRRRIEGGRMVAEPLAPQGSASLAALAGADGLIVLPEEAGVVARGTMVRFLPL